MWGWYPGYGLPQSVKNMRCGKLRVCIGGKHGVWVENTGSSGKHGAWWKTRGPVENTQSKWKRQVLVENTESGEKKVQLHWFLM